MQKLQSEPIYFCELGTVAYVYLAILLDMYLQVSKTDVTFYSIRVALAPITLHTCTGSHDSLLTAGVKWTGPFIEYS